MSYVYNHFINLELYTVPRKNNLAYWFCVRFLVCVRAPSDAKHIGISDREMIDQPAATRVQFKCTKLMFFHGTKYNQSFSEEIYIISKLVCNVKQ